MIEVPVGLTDDKLVQTRDARVKLSFWILFICGCAAAADPGEFFEMKVRPVLAKNCYGCHTSTHMGGLQLDSREHALKGGNSGAAIVPGHAGQSLLIQAITQRHEKFKMPPGGKLRLLSW